MSRRAILFLCALAVLAASLLLSGVVASGSTKSSAASPATASAKKKCKRGYKLKTVTIKRHGKKVKVKRCRKVKGGSGPGPAPLFEPPGRRLVGNEAVPFLQRYLANSRFTDCPAGWPNCGVVEVHYSHFSDGSFYYCRLGPTPGSDIRFSSEYQVQNAVVEADGSWTFNEMVDNYGNPSFYEWHVAADGTVTGVYQFNGVEQLGPFEYVSGARDCSY